MIKTLINLEMCVLARFYLEIVLDIYSSPSNHSSRPKLNY